MKKINNSTEAYERVHFEICQASDFLTERITSYVNVAA